MGQKLGSDRIIPAFNAMHPEGMTITGFQYWFSVFFAHRDFSRFSEFLMIEMHCR